MGALNYAYTIFFYESYIKSFMSFMLKMHKKHRDFQYVVIH